MTAARLTATLDRDGRAWCSRPGCRADRALGQVRLVEFPDEEEDFGHFPFVVDDPGPNRWPHFLVSLRWRQRDGVWRRGNTRSDRRGRLLALPLPAALECPACRSPNLVTAELAGQPAVVMLTPDHRARDPFHVLPRKPSELVGHEGWLLARVQRGGPDDVADLGRQGPRWPSPKL
jgi:hypothetical protein